MKEFKKKLAVILAFCMVLTSTVPAFAATIQEGAETSAQTEDKVLLENDEYEEASPSNTKYEDNILTDEEDIEEVIIEENFEDVALIDDTEEVLPAEDEEAEFFAEVKVGNVIITAKAEAGVVPKGTILKAKKVVDKEVKEAIDEVVEEKRENEAQVVESLKFDIKLLKDDEEIEPDGLVSLSFALADAAANAEANIYHIIEDEETKELVEAEVLEVETVEEPEDEATLVLETEVPGFSYYVVEFTVGELQYVLEGDSSVKLSTILETLKIEGTVTEAVSGAPELFSVEKDAAGDDWTVTALKAFSTEEWMKVTVDEQIYEITVTDDSEVTYTVKFDSKGGTGNMDPQEMTYGTAVNLNQNEFDGPEYAPSFAGWGLTDTSTEPKFADQQLVKNLVTPPTREITLYAVWKEEQKRVVIYSVDVEMPEGGSISRTVDFWDPSSGSPIGCTATAKTGYRFKGWKDASGNFVTDNPNVSLSEDGKTITPAQNLQSDAQYTAVFEKLVSIAEILPSGFPVTETTGWVSDQGTRAYVYSDQLWFKPGNGGAGFGYPLTTLAWQRNTGYEYSNSDVTILFNKSGGVLTSINIPKPCNHGDVFEGTYSPAPTYTVTFDTQGAVPILPQTVMNGEKATKPANPAKPGCEFAGWYTDVSCADGTEYNFNTPVTKDITLYAKWVVVPRATITGLTADKPVYKVDDTIKLTATIDGPDDTEVFFVVSGEKYVLYSYKGKAVIEIPLPFTNPGDYTITASLLNGSNKIITITVKQGSTPDPKKKESSSGTYSVFTGTTGNPVTNGKWTQNADGTWSYATSRKFTSTWGCIANPNDANSAAWYYFDRNGNMLTGWQKLYWNGAYRWYYFSQTKDSNEGKCQLGGITPDGYRVGADGAWIED